MIVPIAILWFAAFSAGFSAALSAAPDVLAEAEAAYRAARFADARDLFTTALTVAPKEAQPSIEAKLGNALRKLGALDESERRFDRALAGARASGDRALEAKVHAQGAWVDHARGDLASARAELDLAAEMLATLEADPKLYAGVLISLGTITRDASQISEAHSYYLRALDVAAAAEVPRFEAMALMGLAVIERHIGALQWSELLLQQASVAFDNAGLEADVSRAIADRAHTAMLGNRFGAAIDLARIAQLGVGDDVVRQQQIAHIIGYSLFRSDDIPGAEQTLRRSLEDEAGTEIISGRARSMMALAELLAATGRTAEAEALINDAVTLDHSHARLADAAGIRGSIARGRGDVTTATEWFEVAVRYDEDERNQFDGSGLTEFFFPDRRQRYSALLELYALDGRVAEAFNLSERLKSRAFASSLVASHDAVVDTAALDRARPGPFAPRSTDALLKGLRRLHDRDERPTAAATIRLADHVRGLSFYVLDDAVLSFWVDRDRVEMARVRVDAKTLHARARTFVDAVSSGAKNYAESGAALAALLLDPWQHHLGAMSTDDALCVVPHGVLHRVPFAAMPVNGGLLIDQTTVFSAPSIGALINAIRRPATAGDGPSLIVGDPYGDLAGARGEVAEVASRSDRARVLVGSAANEASVRSELPSARRIHFAVHAFQGTPRRRSFLEVCPDRGHDGRLSSDEILAHSLKADLVTLSACESGVGDTNLGDEMPDVLSRAFLAAGARSVVATRWRIDDATARAFMRIFYDALPSHGTLRALAIAQRKLRGGAAEVDAGLPVPRGGIDVHDVCAGPARPASSQRRFDWTRTNEAQTKISHPYHWSAFVLIGDHQ